MREAIDLSVYFVADPALCRGRDLTDVVLQALEGGITLVQLRNKQDQKDHIADQAKAIKAITDQYNVPFLINDYADIAIEIDADGVHIGQGDIATDEARKLLGPHKVIGLTAFTEDHIKDVDPNIVDYIGTGPFFETKTDKGKPVLGAGKFADLVALSPLPVVGIGGITPENAAQVIDAGAHGVAMMRAISEAGSPKSQAEKFVLAVSRARQERAA